MVFVVWCWLCGYIYIYIYVYVYVVVAATAVVEVVVVVVEVVDRSSDGFLQQMRVRNSLRTVAD